VVTVIEGAAPTALLLMLLLLVSELLPAVLPVRRGGFATGLMLAAASVLASDALPPCTAAGSFLASVGVVGADFAGLKIVR
jgi:hypothetical protein